jgi:hypothetical protein
VDQVAVDQAEHLGGQAVHHLYLEDQQHLYQLQEEVVVHLLAVEVEQVVLVVILVLMVMALKV